VGARVGRRERAGDRAFVAESIDVPDAPGDERGGDDADGDRYLPRALLRQIRDVAGGVMPKEGRALLLGAGADVVGNEMQCARQVRPGLIDVRLRRRVRRGLRTPVCIVPVQARAAAFLPRCAVPDFFVKEGVQILRGEDSLSLFPRMTECALDDAWRRGCGVIQLRLGFRRQLREVRTKVLL